VSTQTLSNRRKKGGGKKETIAGGASLGIESSPVALASGRTKEKEKRKGEFHNRQLRERRRKGKKKKSGLGSYAVERFDQRREKRKGTTEGETKSASQSLAVGGTRLSLPQKGKRKGERCASASSQTSAPQKE